MQVFVVQHDNVETEFATLEAAEAFAAPLQASVHAVEKQIVQVQQIPDITSRQIRLQIILAGLSLTDITDAISQLPEPHKSLVLVEWEYATMYERQHPFANVIGGVLGLNPADLDALWLAAVEL